MSSSDSSTAAPLPISLPPSPSPTFIVPPVAAASHSSHAGAIAGGVIGGLAFIALVIGALLFALRRHNKKKAQQSVLPWSSGGMGRRRGDVRISSSSGLAAERHSGFDFAKRMSAAGYATGTGNYVNRDIGGALPDRRASTASSVGVPPRVQRHASVSSNTHVESHSNDGYSDEEKNSTLHHDSSSYSHAQKSIDLNDSAIPHLPSEPPVAYSYQDRNRSRSMTGHNRALALAKLDSSVPVSAPYTPSGGASVSRSPSAATYSSQKDPFASPSDKALHRLSSSGGVSRRPTVTRKAVPKYDETEFSMTDLSSNPSSPRAMSPPLLPRTPSPPLGVSAVAARAVSPYALPHIGSNESLRSGAVLTRNGSSRSHAPLPALNHKTSFGDMRPVHYLIPDMPPQQEE
ncbi:hypothetical protein PsYK624_025590 [Phanerochaete sordida]|uniref:Uncharacterized protein n=1 Tax=Phanerochaete sordida TaxID=48140 RepID=A0A9P3G2I7_9APHY|nr:hypothetical protein PsYK624_025590 [Phanerochaete sordida]